MDRLFAVHFEVKCDKQCHTEVDTFLNENGISMEEVAFLLTLNQASCVAVQELNKIQNCNKALKVSSMLVSKRLRLSSFGQAFFGRNGKPALVFRRTSDMNILDSYFSRKGTFQSQEKTFELFVSASTPLPPLVDVFIKCSEPQQWRQALAAHNITSEHIFARLQEMVFVHDLKGEQHFKISSGFDPYVILVPARTVGNLSAAVDIAEQRFKEMVCLTCIQMFL
jgi:hypothetical protein